MNIPNPIKLEIGAQASRTKVISDADIRAFAEASGDTNPLHLNEAFAATTRFGRRIAHGMLTGSLVSAVLGNDLPGVGTIYLSQKFEFKAPVYLGDTITASVRVTDYRASNRIVTLHTTCTNQDGTIVLDGEAVVIAPKS
jgi:acyl dehydratase